MKRKTAKEILAASFRELAESKSIDKITIQEITDNCGYSPATFYRNFQDKYDLIAWEYAAGTAAIMNRVHAGEAVWTQTLLDGARRFWREKEYLANLFRHTTGQDSFVRYMTDIHFTALQQYILSSSGKPALDQKEDLCVRLYCLGTVMLTCEWILGSYDATPEEIAAIYEDAIPQALQQYLL